MGGSQKTVTTLFSSAGITINGKQAHDIQVHNKKFYRRVLADKSLGFGDSYMDGWWDVKDMLGMLKKVMTADIESAVRDSPKLLFHAGKARVLNLQDKRRAREVGVRHYDLGNDLYRAMLDKGMNYSCGFWQGTNDLDVAQEQKLELICRKLDLREGERVLDIGCGWGGFAQYATEHFGVEVTGVTISKEQAAFAQERTKKLPVHIKLIDYRDVKGKFDKIVSIGMIEHVGYKNYRKYMEKAYDSLKDNGLFLLHTIGGLTSVKGTDPWIAKHIFPNSMLPSLAQLTKAAEGLFVIEDVHNFGVDYAKTLHAWHQNFTAAWPNLKGKYSPRFKRMWDFYLQSCEASFSTRRNQLWQIVLSKGGVDGVYQRPVLD